MAQEVRSFVITIPHGTLQTAPITTELEMPPRVVRQINIRVPPGPRGEMGFQIGASGVQVIPHNVGQYLVLDDESLSWQLDNQIDSGGWEISGYNNGDYDHTIHIRFLVDPVTEQAAPGQTQPIQF